jgi:hypothetical protein
MNLRQVAASVGARLRGLPPGARSPRAARLFRRDRCGLCDEALALLAPHIQSGRLLIEQVDIQGDPALFRRYCLTIPVLAIDGGTTLNWPFDARDVWRALA